VPNWNGHAPNLVPSHPGNANAAKHGLYSDRVLAPRIEAYREELLARRTSRPSMRSRWTSARGYSREIEAVDRDLDEREHFGKRGARALLDHWARLRCAGDCATSTASRRRLWLCEPRLVVGCGERPANADDTYLKIDDLRGEPENLAPAHPRRRSEAPGRRETGLANVHEEAAELGGCPRLRRAPRGGPPRRVGGIGHVAREPVPANGVGERLANGTMREANAARGSRPSPFRRPDTSMSA
jgi:hypothetical protein